MSGPLEQIVIWHRLVPPTRPERDRPELLAQWCDRVETLFLSAGADLIARIGSSLALCFEATELSQAVELCLRTLDDADADQSLAGGGLPATLGVAFGELDTRNKRVIGATIDRAQLLANRARRGELVVDATMRELIGSNYLFSRSVGGGAAALRGAAIDRKNPRRSECRNAIAHLQTPGVARPITAALQPLKQAIDDASTSRFFLLRGPAGSGARSWMDSLLEMHPEKRRLRVSATPGRLEPRGALRMALLRQYGNAARVAESLGDAMASVAAGAPIPQSALEESLKEAFQGGAWIEVESPDRLDAVSTASLVKLALEVPTVLVLRERTETPLPSPFDSLQWEEILLPVLRGEDAKALAKELVGKAADDVIQRIATLGGDTAVGVAEAGRMLVASGDLIWNGKGFVWRNSPRSGVRAIPLPKILEERLDGLEDQARRLLEAVCAAPAGAPRLLVAAIAEHDGLTSELRREAASRLRDEGFVTSGNIMEPCSSALRRVVMQQTPPSRRAELFRFVAQAMTNSSVFEGMLAQATIGHYFSQGSNGRDGAESFLRAAEGCIAAGLPDNQRKLSAAAVACCPDPDIRTRAAAIARRQPPDSLSISLEEATSADVAVGALLRGDLGGAEKVLEGAIAAGKDLGAANRLRAMVLMAKGDITGAQAMLDRVPESDEYDVRARLELSRAWLKLHLGEINAAARQALLALALARRSENRRGEAAALHTLAACFRTLGRTDEADAISHAAQ